MKKLILKKKKISYVEVEEEATFAEYVGHKIRMARKKRNMTQDSLSQQIEITRSSIVNIEKGRQKISLEKFFLCCKVLKTKPQDFLPL